MNRKGGGGQQRCYLHLNPAKGSVSQRSYPRNNSTSTRFPQNRTTEQAFHKCWLQGQFQNPKQPTLQDR